MKIKLFIFLLFALCPWFLANAGLYEPDYEGFPTIIHNETAYLQEYRPKFWCLHVDTDDGGFINLDYRLAGDTLLMGSDYVRTVFGYEEKKDLYESDYLQMSAIRPNGDTYADTLYYRQEGDKVYCLQPKDNKEILIIDYGLGVGDEFADANGEVYIVTDTTRQSNNKYFSSWYYYRPKRLNLVSRRTGEKDIWIEGLGSMNWGITPYFLMAQNRVFTKLGLLPSQAQVSMGYGGNLLLGPNVNTDNYKAEMIDLGGNYDGGDIFVNYEFQGDTLYVEGVKIFDHFAGYHYAECFIDDGRIDIMVKQFYMYFEEREYPYIFDIRIPGFQPGIYQVGMPGREYVTLECKGGTTGIGEVKSEGVNAEGVASKKRERSGKSEKYDDAIYDLSGKKIACQQKRVNIINGRKVLVK